MRLNQLFSISSSAILGKEDSSSAESYHLFEDTQDVQGVFILDLQYTQRALDTRSKLIGEQQTSTAGNYHLLGIKQHKQVDSSSDLQSTTVHLILGSNCLANNTQAQLAVTIHWDQGT